MSILVFTSVCRLSQMIREREVSAVKVLDAHLAQVEKHNSTLNAICTLDAAQARSRAEQADKALARGESWGTLHGVPLTVKDLFETSSLRTTSGSMALCNYIPQNDATGVSRLRTAGAIILGKTNVGDLAFNLTGHPVVVIPIGRTENGLPIGTQIVGRRWQEMELLAIAQAVDHVINEYKRPAGY